MRLFFALEPDPATALAIADWRDRNLPLAGRPVPMANLHITLAFIGDLDNGRLERLADSVDAWQDRPGGGELVLDTTGYWPRPGIYWLGPRGCPGPLERLAGKLGSLSSAVGGRRDKRRYQPHVTLFRGCEQPPAASEIPAIGFAYRDFTLFESRQGRQGASYHPLMSWELG